MISKEIIKSIVDPKLDEENVFLVDISVSPSNQIVVTVDGDKGVTIDQCIAISRHIEGSLNRDEEDFELEVSSSGLGQPLKVLRQYTKNIGREVEVVLTNGSKLKGKMVASDNEGISLEVEKKLLLEGKKRKELVTETIPLKYSEIKTTKVVISFR